MSRPRSGPGDPDLFAAGAERRRREQAPLAERMRPRSLDEVIGQEHLIAPGKLIERMIQGGRLSSLILWGPPGTGKTTLASLIAGATDADFVPFSAVLSGIRELRDAIATAAERLAQHGRRTVLFVDEIHRLNKAQQDAFLPHVEKGTVLLIGATTENPSFEVIAPLLSRAAVVTLEALTADDIGGLLDRALSDPDRGLGKLELDLAPEARTLLAERAMGDARFALNLLENAANLATARSTRALDVPLVEEATQQRALRYDKSGDEHFNVVSAFIKSMRGSDPDAALYWLARMIEAGEDPLFIARRIVIFASEDIGTADPHSLPIAIAARDAVHFVGMPEGRIPLAHAVAHLASAPKSNAAYRAIGLALDDVRQHGPLPVPLHLRNAPTKLMKGMGYGSGYRYAHDYDGNVIDQQHLPDRLRDRTYYEPSENGAEAGIRKRLESHPGRKR